LARWPNQNDKIKRQNILLGDLLTPAHLFGMSIMHETKVEKNSFNYHFKGLKYCNFVTQPIFWVDIWLGAVPQ
jgi:hypothetical protein